MIPFAESASRVRPALAAALCVTAVAALGACETMPPPVETAGMGAPAADARRDPPVAVLAPELRPWLEFMPAARRGGGDRVLEVEVPMRNNAARKYLLEYRFRFFGPDGFEEQPVMSWTFVPVEPGQVVRLQGSSLSSGALDHKLEIRWSR